MFEALTTAEIAALEQFVMPASITHSFLEPGSSSPHTQLISTARKSARMSSRISIIHVQYTPAKMQVIVTLTLFGLAAAKQCLTIRVDVSTRQGVFNIPAFTSNQDVTTFI
jgi:hypothetical protein